MTIIDEILPKVKTEVRLDKANKTLWIKTDTLVGYGRVIIEDGSNWCRVFYEDKTEPSNSEKPNNCERITEDGVTCAKYPACDDCPDNPLNKVKGSERLLKGKDESQTERSE